MQRSHQDISIQFQGPDSCHSHQGFGKKRLYMSLYVHVWQITSPRTFYSKFISYSLTILIGSHCSCAITSGATVTTAHCSDLCSPTPFVSLVAACCKLAFGVTLGMMFEERLFFCVLPDMLFYKILPFSVNSNANKSLLYNFLDDEDTDN
jgi:hypothetical protein